MGTLENFNVHDLGNYNSRMTKEQVRDKVYKDKNIEIAIKDGVENYLDSIMKQLYPSTASAEYEYLSDYTLITTEIFEEGYVISDVHIDVNMIIYDYSSKDDNKKERYIALNNNYLMGLNLKFTLRNIDDDIEDIEVRYFNIYGFTDNLKNN
ncbi:hypothetical protein [uncultured Brachyspira sp.]|uniref:hypothetical protein n=1 Tax=uncultured Brachyspira sp. TaxID=221953 RepID=UPI00261B58A9|nr:hypothetical protein [uncultured Brachyspira sp.]